MIQNGQLAPLVEQVGHLHGWKLVTYHFILEISLPRTLVYLALLLIFTFIVRKETK